MSDYDTDADNRLSSDGTWDYTYDAKGKMTEKDAVVDNMKWTCGYNHRNQLSRADRKSNGSSIDLTVNYTHDAWGNRVTKAVDFDGPGIGKAAWPKWM